MTENELKEIIASLKEQLRKATSKTERDEIREEIKYFEYELNR